MSTSAASPQQADDAEAQKRRAIMAITLDASLTEAEKARRRQELMMGSWATKPAASSRAGKPGALQSGKEAAGSSGAARQAADAAPKAAGAEPCLWHHYSMRVAHRTRTEVQAESRVQHTGLHMTGHAACKGQWFKPFKRAPLTCAVPTLDENLKCAICMDLCERPVTVRAAVVASGVVHCGMHAQVANCVQLLASHTAGALPAQLLPWLLQKVGAARQEDVPHVPRRLPNQVCP